MIIGIGTDLAELPRIEEACGRAHFLNRVFTEAERREALGKPSMLAGDFAVKEAVAKALGTGFAGFGPWDIEVLRDALGKPEVRLFGGALKRAGALGVTRVHASISDTKDAVLAFAVAEGQDAVL